jgi:hypothetical protein
MEVVLPCASTQVRRCDENCKAVRLKPWLYAPGKRSKADLLKRPHGARGGRRKAERLKPQGCVRGDH